MAAQPLLYNKGRHEAIVTAMRQGSYRAEAARVVGISSNTLLRWLAEGEAASEAGIDYDEPAGRYRKLFEDVEQAEAEYELEMRSHINMAAREGPKNWTAAAWSLERKYPERYGRREALTIEGGAKPIRVATGLLLANPEALEAANELLKTLTGRRNELEPADGVPELPGPELEGEVIEEDEVT